MSQNFQLSAEARTVSGTAQSRRMRREQNLVPAVIYGGGEAPAHITLPHNKAMHALENEAFYSSILTIDIAGSKEEVVIKDIQRHPSRPFILHMDFLRIRSDAEITMGVPLHFLGEEEAPGFKEGGIVSHFLNELEMTCLPKNLPEYIDVDVSQLALNATIHLSEIKLPKGIALTVDVSDPEHNQPVVGIHPPRAAEEEEEVAEEVEVEAEEESTEGEEPTKE